MQPTLFLHAGVFFKAQTNLLLGLLEKASYFLSLLQFMDMCLYIGGIPLED